MISMSHKKKHFDKGRAHGGANCTRCGDEFSKEKITESRTWPSEPNETHHYDRDGELVRMDVTGRGTETHEPGSYCWDCHDKAEEYSGPEYDHSYYDKNTGDIEYN